MCRDIFVHIPNFSFPKLLLYCHNYNSPLQRHYPLRRQSSNFFHRKNAIGGMANFDIAKGTLNTIGLDCPIWLIGING